MSTSPAVRDPWPMKGATPGPWHLDADASFRTDIPMGGKIVAADGRIVVAECCNAGVMEREDAALIAEAPNLLQSLKHLVELFDGYVDASVEETAAFDFARLTIAKAEGRPA